MSLLYQASDVKSPLSALLRIMAPTLSPLQQLVEEMLFISDSTSHLLYHHWTLKTMLKILESRDFLIPKASQVQAP